MTASVTDEPIGHDDQGLRDISAAQWKSGLAAWLGWLFDGLDMHLYTLVAAPFVAALAGALRLNDPRVALVRLVDSGGVPAGLGAGRRPLRPARRSPRPQPGVVADDPELCPFHRLSSFAQTWWHLLIFRFLAALGIGGEWAIGASLLSRPGRGGGGPGWPRYSSRR